ncbi:MAG TPA: hypothetical protein VF855_14030, partial [Acidimicrobiales bacterium]
APAHRKRRGLVALIVAVALLAVGGGVTAVVLSQDDGGGAGSPEGAITDVLDALEAGDLLGVLDSLAPAESRVLKDYVEDAVAEGKRLGVLDNDVDLGNVPGIGFTAQDIGTTVEPVTDDIANVSLVSGTVALAPDLDRLPYGDVIDRLLKASGTEVTDPDPQTIDLGTLEDPPRLTAIRDGGRWYASLMYSAAEAWRSDSGSDAPNPDAAIPAKGADSPEEAVEALLKAIGDADVAAVIERLDPDEMAVLHDYGALFSGDGNGLGAADFFKVRLVDWAWERADVTGGVKVIPTKVVLQGEVSFGSLWGDEISDMTAIRIEVERIDGPCLRYRVVEGSDTNEDTVCATDLRDSLVEGGVEPELADIAVRQVSALATVGIVTVERDGKWYVSPLRTVGDLSLTNVRALEPGDMDILVDEMRALSEG